MRRYALILGLFLLVSCSEAPPTYPHRNIPTELFSDTIYLTEANELFLKQCANCHGRLSEGRHPRADFFQPPAPDFTASSYRQVDPAYLFWRISEGKTVEPYLSRGSVMPAFGMHFNDEKIWHLVAYLQTRSLHK